MIYREQSLVQTFDGRALKRSIRPEVLREFGWRKRLSLPAKVEQSPKKFLG